MFDRKAWMKEYHKKHYANNRDKYIERSKRWNVDNPERRKEIANKSAKKEYRSGKNRATFKKCKAEAIELCGNKCNDCGVSYPACVYDFHHVDPTTKHKELAKLFVGRREIWLKELEKCVMLCSNCHRLRHHLDS